MSDYLLRNAMRMPSSRCPCPICNAPDNEPHCFECRRTLSIFLIDRHEDAKGNPICDDCNVRR